MTPVQKTHSGQKNYWSMYSSWFDKIVTDPAWMLVPIDDHLFHRGDGVFEAIKWTAGKVYLIEAHLQRLRRSAERISLPIPWTDLEIKQIIDNCLDQGLKQNPTEKEAIIRIFVSRGPGNFSPNPYDSVGSQLYVVITRLSKPPAEKYTAGASLGRSHVESKSSDWASYKTCNYLPNVMMKKESVDRGFDFVVGFDPSGFMTEASTENVVILSQRNELLKPKKDYILQGTTMNRAFQLSHQLAQQGLIVKAGEADITEEMIRTAKEIMIIGTTWDVLPVTSYEGQKIGHGQRGPIAEKLGALLLQDQASS